MSGLTLRPATLDDLPVLRTLMSMAIAENMKAFLSAELIQASNKVMGLDTLLVEDGTYWIVHRNGEPAGCGGWSRRNTLYGGDHSAGRSPALLDPAVDAARVRAMYTHPSYVRRGIGRLILDHCEMAAAREGFTRLQLAATLAGAPLYRAYGFQEVERFTDHGVPLIRMEKAIILPAA